MMGDIAMVRKFNSVSYKKSILLFFFYWYTLCLYTGSVFRTEKSPERPTNLLRSSGKKRQFFKNKLTWQVDTHMVLSQTKYILIPHHAMPQILLTGLHSRRDSLLYIEIVLMTFWWIKFGLFCKG